MNKYLVTIQKVEVIEMIVSGNSNRGAVKKVDNLLNDCVKHGVNLNMIFDKPPFFRYQVSKIKNKK